LSLSARRQLELCRFERKIDYRFKDKLLIHKALTHKSYADEKKWSHTSCNERLELLGDAVLDLVVVKHLFEKYPNHTEGQITKIKGYLVCGNTLTELSERMGIMEFLLVGKEFENNEPGSQRKQKSILADAFEAIIGAIYRDGGWDEARKFIEKKVIEEELSEVLTTGKYYNYKSKLQELSQKEYRSLPDYRVLKEDGPDHCKYFKVSVSINRKVVGRGEGENKKEAEQNAAQDALSKMKNKVFKKSMNFSLSSLFKWDNLRRKRKNNVEVKN